MSWWNVSLGERHDGKTTDGSFRKPLKNKRKEAAENERVWLFRDEVCELLIMLLWLAAAAPPPVCADIDILHSRVPLRSGRSFARAAVGR